MYGPRIWNHEEIPSTRFLKYGLEVFDDGSLYKMKKPPSCGHTPLFNNSPSKIPLLQDHAPFLHEWFFKPFRVQKYQSQVLGIVNAIFQEITGLPFSNFAHIVIMSELDFSEYTRRIDNKQREKRGLIGEYHGLNRGGLIIIKDEGSNACFPVLFHELGHNLYPDEHDGYVDEFRAEYFQILATKRLEQELGKISLEAHYPDMTDFPSPEHKQAFQDAKKLYKYQTSPHASHPSPQHIQAYLKIIKQPCEGKG